jgi:hypothetical protein
MRVKNARFVLILAMVGLLAVGTAQAFGETSLNTVVSADGSAAPAAAASCYVGADMRTAAESSSSTSTIAEMSCLSSSSEPGQATCAGSVTMDSGVAMEKRQTDLNCALNVKLP